jgi:hypothetical protein
LQVAGYRLCGRESTRSNGITFQRAIVERLCRSSLVHDRGLGIFLGVPRPICRAARIWHSERRQYKKPLIGGAQVPKVGVEPT